MKYLFPLLAGFLFGQFSVQGQDAPPQTKEQAPLQDLFRSIRTTLLQELEQNIDSGLTRKEDSGTITAAIDIYLTAAQKAYDAQMDFALYSLKPLYVQDSQLYLKTLQAYRKLLQENYLVDLQFVKFTSSLLCPQYDSSEPLPKPEEDTFAEAIDNRGKYWDDYGRGRLTSSSQSAQFKMAHFRLKQQFLYALMAPADAPGLNKQLLTDATCGEHLADFEFISCTRLNHVPEGYQATRAAKFMKAEEEWEKYISAAAYMISPDGFNYGTGVGEAKQSLKMDLTALHEAFLTKLMKSLRETQ